MKSILLVLLSVFLIIAVQTSDLPHPSELVPLLDEDQFEAYLDYWLEKEQLKWMTPNLAARDNGGCVLEVNGDLGHPQPVYIHNNDYLKPYGTTGRILMANGDQVRVECVNRKLKYGSTTSTESGDLITCRGGTLFASKSEELPFSEYQCSLNSVYEAVATGEKCYNGHTTISVGFTVENVFHPLFENCFDEGRLEVLYSKQELTPENGIHQTGITRPSWQDGSFYPDIDVNNLYTQVVQKEIIAKLVGEELADKYIVGNNYLARGHLTAKTDLVFATGQRATHYFINAAPQWQGFNGGNWNTLEQNVRRRIAAAGYNATVYTGTHGVAQLHDQQDRLVDLYLHTDANNNPQLPVPLYYYKAIYEPTLEQGVVFVGVNNPYYTDEELEALTFCTDRCRDNEAYSWTNWNYARVDLGYGFCCEIDDFRRTVPHLPDFPVKGLLV